MILEKLENWRALFSGEAWARAFTALQALGADSPEGRTDFLGEGGCDMYRRVLQYETRPAADCKLEAHRDFIDIHIILSGAERIDWFPASDLAVKTPYEPIKDAVFFECPSDPAPASIELRPGYFAVFFPNDAHLTQIMLGQPAPIRKGLIKVRTGLVK